MGITDIFWLFFMFSALQPMLRQRMLEAMRTRKMSQIERQRGRPASNTCRFPGKRRMRESDRPPSSSGKLTAIKAAEIARRQ
jgi:hypothetical protein